MSGREPTYAEPDEWGKVLAVGSVLSEAQPGDVIWGSGAIRAIPVDVTAATVLAVRGPLSRELCRGDVPEAFGDPAVLLPGIYTPRVTRRFSVGLVPHFVDAHLMMTNDPSVAHIDVTSIDWRSTVDAICACDTIVTSSLHGLIVAEAYGVPAVWVQASTRVIGDGFKFRDYYASTDRDRGTPFPWQRGLAAAVTQASEPHTIDPTPLIRAWRRFWQPGAA